MRTQKKLIKKQNPTAAGTRQVMPTMPPVSSRNVAPPAPDAVKDEASVRHCLQELVDSAAQSGTLDSALGKSVMLLHQAYWNARLSWKQVASILRSGIQHGELYRYLFENSKEEIEAWVGSPGENFVQLLAFMAAVREKKKPLKPAPQYFLKGIKHVYRTNRSSNRATIPQSSIADTEESNLRQDSEFAAEVMELAQDQPVKFWAYEAVRNWFVPCDSNFDLCEDKTGSQFDELTRLILAELCFERSLGILAVHPCDGDGKAVELQLQRVRILRQRASGPRVVLIPGYYQPTQIRSHDDRDFIDLYGCMSRPYQKRTRESLSAITKRTRQRMKELMAEGKAHNEARELVQREENWTYETARKRLGITKTLLCQRKNK